MIKLKNSDYKGLPDTCLLAVYLFFSFIAIAGYRVNTNSVFRQREQTTLVYSTESSTTNRTVSYRKYVRPVKKIVVASLKYRLISLLVHNRLTKVKVNRFSKNLNPILTPVRFVQIKIIPQNSGEDHFTSFPS
jgi:hypothetical protein